MGLLKNHSPDGFICFLYFSFYMRVCFAWLIDYLRNLLANCGILDWDKLLSFEVLSTLLCNFWPFPTSRWKVQYFSLFKCAIISTCSNRRAPKFCNSSEAIGVVCIGNLRSQCTDSINLRATTYHTLRHHRSCIFSQTSMTLDFNIGLSRALSNFE